VDKTGRRIVILSEKELVMKEKNSKNEELDKLFSAYADESAMPTESVKNKAKQYMQENKCAMRARRPLLATSYGSASGGAKTFETWKIIAALAAFLIIALLLWLASGSDGSSVETASYNSRDYALTSTTAEYSNNAIIPFVEEGQVTEYTEISIQDYGEFLSLNSAEDGALSSDSTGDGNDDDGETGACSAGENTLPPSIVRYFIEYKTKDGISVSLCVSQNNMQFKDVKSPPENSENINIGKLSFTVGRLDERKTRAVFTHSGYTYSLDFYSSDMSKVRGALTDIEEKF